MEGETSLADISVESSREWAAAFWTTVVDELTGETAYVNPASGESAWSLPPGSLVLPSGKGGQWWELCDPQTSANYYFNTRDRRVTWTRPEQTLIIPLQAVQQSSLGKRLSLVVEHASLPSLLEDAEESDSDASYTTPLATPQQSPVRAAAFTKPVIHIEGVPEVTTEEIHNARLARATTIVPPIHRVERPIRQRAATAPAGAAQRRLPSPPPGKPQQPVPVDFADMTFAERRVGLFRRRVRLEDVLRYQENRLDKPLLLLPKPLRPLALQSFEHVLAITTTGDMTSACIWTKPILDEARALTALALTHAAIQDEVYLQCLKQLVGVPTRPNALRAWGLMQCLLASFPPGPILSGYLDIFFAGAELVVVDRIETIAKYCRRQLVLIAERGARTRIPLPLKEVEAASTGAFLTRLFGESLKTITKREKADDKNVTMPIVLPFLCHLLDKAKAKEAEGIFRVPGNVDAVIELRVRLDCSNYATRLDDGQEADAFTLASLLKLFLRELREPLIQFLAPSVMAKTKMSLTAIAMCFGPCLFRTSPLSLSTAREFARLENRFIERLLLTAPALLDAAAGKPADRQKRGSEPNLVSSASQADDTPRKRFSSMPVIVNKRTSSRGRLPSREV